MVSRPARLRCSAFAVLTALGSVWWLLAGAASAQGEPTGGGRVLTVALDDMVGPVTADHLVEAVGRAERGGFEAVVVVIDTPGGLDTSMRRITQRFLEADVPVIAYVSPRGARAASAGAIITLAAHVAAMAPGTAIGAATPVDLEGGDVERKIVNDAAALAESLARLRGRDVEFYVDAVREGRSASADEAVEVGAVDLLAGSLDELLDEVDGTEVEVAGGRLVTLATAGADIEEHEMGLFRRILRVLADPNLAFLFLSIGSLGLIYELASPGVGVGGVLGGVMIVLAMFGLSVLTVNVAGIVFLLLAVVLFVAELFAPGIGVFAALGALSLVLSGIFLFDDASGISVSAWVMLPTALLVGVAVVGAGRLALRARAAPSKTTGSGLFVGAVVDVRRVHDGRAQALVEGAWWSLRADRPLAVGDRVRIVGVDGLDLVAEHVGGTSTTNRESNHG